MRSTLTDIAREAGVSPATVDRVLHNRSGVRARTRELVTEAAMRLGYIVDGNGHAAIATGAIRLDFVLPAGTNLYIKALHRQIETQAKDRIELDVHMQTIEGFNPDALAGALQALPDGTQGVGVIALDHPTVREAIRSLAAKGVKVVTLASDILHVPRVAYIGIDNRAAGRLAGYILGRFLGTKEPRKVALFAGSLSYRGHEEREMGFRHIIAEEYPNLSIVELREVLDDRETAFLEASAMLDRHEDLAAIYNIGAGSEGIGRALKERKRHRSIVFVTHEVTESNKVLLLEGTIDALIDQNPRVEAREALNILTRAVRNQPYQFHPPRLLAVFKENIPED